MSAGFHIGTFLLFVALLLLIFVSVSAPVWKELGFLKITGLPNFDNGVSVVFGVFGYCIKEAGVNECSKASVGYQLGDAVEAIVVGTHFGSHTLSTLHALTGALILHPIAAGITFVAWLTAAGAHRIGFLCSSLIAFVAWVATLMALVLDFVMFEIVKRHVNRSNDLGVRAQFSSAIWLVVAAFVILFLGSITVCLGCLTDRRDRRRRY